MEKCEIRVDQMFREVLPYLMTMYGVTYAEGSCLPVFEGELM
jgi:hypothetical protein